MHGFGKRKVGEAVVEVADVVRCCPETVSPVDDEFGFVVESLDGTVVDWHPEVVEDAILVAAVASRQSGDCVGAWSGSPTRSNG